MKKIVVIIFCMSISISSNLIAQESISYLSEVKRTEINLKTDIIATHKFTVYSHNSQVEKITGEQCGTHFLGDQIAKKMYMLEEKYLSEEQIAPGNPQTKTVIRKPIIYGNVKKIEKYFKKSVKNGEVSMEAASVIFDKILDVTLLTLTSDTKKFEDELQSLDDMKEKIKLFTERVELNYL